MKTIENRERHDDLVVEIKINGKKYMADVTYGIDYSGMKYGKRPEVEILACYIRVPLLCKTIDLCQIDYIWLLNQTAIDIIEAAALLHFESMERAA